MKKPLLFYCFLMLLFWSTSLQAQDRTVSGVVTAQDDGLPMPGVTVIIKGTSTGTVTDIDGAYTIAVPNDNAILQFSSVGYKTVERSVGAQSSINITLEASTQIMDEIVVVGYGTERTEALTGSINTINSEEFEQIPTASFQESLQGLASGVQVTANDGSPGAGINVRVRGIGSINAGNDPLYVIDGIPVTSGSVSQTDFGNDGRSSNVLSSLNPNDIASITILKDASSTAIYGSRGANGVVLITTKQGSQGKAKIDLRAQVGFSDFAFNNLLEPLNRDQYTELYLEGRVNAGSTPEEAQALFDQQFPENANTNWIDEISQTGITQQYDLSASGGNEKIQYFASLGYFDQEGTVVNNKFTRYSSRINLAAQLTPKLRVTNNITLSYFTQRGITDGTRWQAPFYVGFLMAPTVPVLDDLGRYYGEHTFFMGANNPVGHLNEDRRELEQTRIIDNFTASYEIMDGLRFTSAWSFDILNVDEFIFNNGRYGDGRNVGGTGNEARTDIINWLGTQTLNYDLTIADKHSITALLGYEAQKVTQDITEASGEGYPHPDLNTLASAANPTQATSERTEYAFNSIFSRINYNFDERYYLSASIRTDGSSRFGPDSRWGTFWSVGGSYRISEESFFDNVDFINQLKLRVSYGVTGNANIGDFDWATLYEFEREYDGLPAAAPEQVGDRTLTWESQENFNVGLDLGLFNGRLNATADYFIRTSTDLILDNPLSYTTGFREIKQNVGDMENRGLELALSGDILDTRGFRLNAAWNITFITNEITFLPSAIVDGTKRREEGRDFQEYYLFGWAGVNPADGAPLWYTDESKTETTSNINDAARFYDGKTATPDFFGGFNLSASYKGITVSAQLNYMFGHHVYDGPGWVIHGDGRFTPRSTSTWAFENRWQQPGDDALFPRFAWGNTSASNTRNSSRYLFAGDYIRLRNVNISYQFPNALTDKLKLRSLQAYVNLRNFWTWVTDDNLHFDPEQTTNGVYNTVTPISKTVQVGVNIGL